MLIDDNKDDNFFHERVIRKNNCAEKIISMESGKAALEYLRSETFESHSPPELIFLDINMPGMSGWEFLDEYDKLDQELKSKVIVTMLTTSDNPDDVAKAAALCPSPLKEFRTKPLTKEMLEEIIGRYF
jgi:CheY-like chemotaxis protein